MVLVSLGLTSDPEGAGNMYAILGSAAVFGGTMRCTVSICVILLEMTHTASTLPYLMLVRLQPLLFQCSLQPLSFRQCRVWHCRCSKSDTVGQHLTQRSGWLQRSSSLSILVGRFALFLRVLHAYLCHPAVCA